MDTNKLTNKGTGFDQLVINKVLEVIRGKWRLSIILLLDEKPLRYSELRVRLPAVSEKVLADELKALSTLGVLSRTVYAEVPPRVEYALTEKGLQALPVLTQLKEVGRIFAADEKQQLTNEWSQP